VSVRLEFGIPDILTIAAKSTRREPMRLFVIGSLATLAIVACASRSSSPETPVGVDVPDESEPAPPEVATTEPTTPSLSECTPEEQAALASMTETPDKSCADVKARLGTSTDGPQTIQPEGQKPFRVWCSGMNTSKPLEYLELPRTSKQGEKTSNYSGLVFGRVHGSQRCPCQAAVTRYEKVRLDPTTMEIVTTDTTFAVVDLVDESPTCFQDNERRCNKGWFSAEPLPYGVAAGCRRRTPTGRANIDLSCTPFHIAPTSPFGPVGYHPVGDIQFHPSRKAAAIRGGGDCGAFGAVHPEKEPRRPPQYRNIVIEQDG
jgi:hypothetical protein